MLSQQALEGNWNQIKGKVREKWGQISDDDLENLKGKGDQLVGAIQRKTGEAREQIERFLNQAVDSGASITSRAAEGARQYAGQAMDQMSQAGDQVGESFRRGYEQAESMIHERPAESVAVAFGLGVVLGTVLGIIPQRSLTAIGEKLDAMDNDRQAENIRDAMARLRREADANAEIVRSRAREMTDWRHYVRQYPKTSLLTAASIGYLIVPARLRGSKPGPRGLAASLVGPRAAAAAGAETPMWEQLLTSAAKLVVRNGIPWIGQEAIRWWGRRSQPTHEGNGAGRTNESS